MTRSIFLLLLVAGISACSNTKYCEREQGYHSAKEDPYLRAPAGLTVPEPDASYIVPQISTQAEAAALSSDRPCLEIPPRLRNETVVGEEDRR